ncbi:MAG: amidohydrolase family protein [Dehalococcoidia bacterium]|nr:amidohydrolase family protein [Dehalococcoidia bacterium]
MSTVVHHTTVVTADAGRRVLTDAALAVEGDRIIDLGPAEEVLARHPDAERIAGRGKVVMPGFANCHTHFTLTLNRGIQEDFSFPSTLRFPRAAADYLHPEEREVFAQLGALEAIRSGTTAAFEIGRNLDGYADALAECGIRIVLGETAADLDQPKAAREHVFEFNEARGEAGLERIEALHASHHGAGDGRISVAVAAHAPEAVSPRLLRRLRDLAERLDTIATVHLNQSWWEVEAVRDTRGVLPAEYLFQQDFLWPRLVAGHCRCMGTREVALLGRSRAWVSFNAAIAARRGYSPRIADLAAAGSPIAMGSDNMAEDMVEVMRTGLFMERVRTGDGERPTPDDVLQWATANGHRALGLEESGSLEVGKQADFIIVDTRRAHLVPAMRFVSAFVHQGQGRDVESMMVGGRWVMRDGQVVTMDEDRTVRDAERIARRAWRQLLEDYPEVPFPVHLDTAEPVWAGE